MPQNEAPINIPPAVLVEVNTKLNEIVSALAPYLTSLSEQDRKRMAKMSDKTIAFVAKVKDYLTTNPQFTPNFMNPSVVVNGLNNFNALNPLLQLTLQLSGQLSDTVIASGSEAYVSSLQYYGFVKQAAKGKVPGAEEVHEDLTRRFVKQRKAAAPLKAA